MQDKEQKLLELFRCLPAAEAGSLIDFAEFLASRPVTFTSEALTSPVAKTEPVEPVSPVEIPRPDGESVIGAVKRLSATYHMLSKDKMLQETADLVSQSLLGGRETIEVIDELEEIFVTQYQKYTEDMSN